MEAKAKPPHRVVRAFTGLEFVHYEWRRVPAGCDDEAERLEAAGLLEFSQLPAAPPPVPVVKVDATRGAISLAVQSGVDLADVVGSAFGGRILKSDVEMVLEEEE